ncbi:hypothetical protein N7462_002373 [Penicillium macrosclerotiorum]|uniref:uncharacterized protein n=1 Tax=Penicillium macrosclerotiorum TaxID=303699 RepID=UPI0025474CFD|nr:uncharacterized protein N7462_002373 [Penicillium macrosclerotiorum]KAJ5692950.1 hypothetical protein N7462_002373 [Penicillium macrosclerotiorum]
MEGWPWGFVIYRTSFRTTSDQDWTAVIEKIDRYCHRRIFHTQEGFGDQFAPQPNIRELVWEGYRNVIVEDPNLEFAPIDTIRKRHIEWVEGQGYDRHIGRPRFDYCIVLDDRSIRSILASSEPDDKSDSALVGYVNVIDCDFDPNDPENDSGEFYDGSLRVCLKDIVCFALMCEDLQTGEQQWGDWGMERPGKVIYTDGYASRLEEQDVFLCPSDYDINSRFREPKIPRHPIVTESEYRERQSIIIESQAAL